ncbi:MAG: undecaprenyl-diphosphate phosphatase [Nautiliaceae bacterium]
MTIIDSIILGIVEGITEFLPISSTAHMIIVSKLLKIPQTQNHIAFEVIIQLGATLAIVLIYLNKIKLKEINLWLKVFIAFLPLAVVGLIAGKYLKPLFTIKTSAIMFIIGGFVFFLVEAWHKKRKNFTEDVEKVSFKQAFIIGLFQIFAIIPGTSRSGATIVGGMLSGLSRKCAADFSFLLAIPTMFAASGYEILKNLNSFSSQNIIVLATGFIVSFISSYIAVKWFLKFVTKYTLIPFGVYRIVFGIILLYLIYSHTL